MGRRLFLLSSRFASAMTKAAVREGCVGVLLMKIESRSYPAQIVFAFSHRKHVGRRRSHFDGYVSVQVATIMKSITALTFTRRRLHVLQA